MHLMSELCWSKFMTETPNAAPPPVASVDDLDEKISVSAAAQLSPRQLAVSLLILEISDASDKEPMPDVHLLMLGRCTLFCMCFISQIFFLADAVCL